MGRFSVNGLTVATAVTDAHAISAIWNPHATKRISARMLAAFAAAAPGAGAGFELRRITARGTAGSTVTPAIAQAHDRGAAPVSGFLLDLAAYTVQPTLEAVALGLGFVFAAVAASGIVMPLDDIEIGPGAGLAMVNRAGIIVPALEVTWVIEE